MYRLATIACTDLQGQLQKFIFSYLAQKMLSSKCYHLLRLTNHSSAFQFSARNWTWSIWRQFLASEKYDRLASFWYQSTETGARNWPVRHPLKNDWPKMCFQT